MSMRPWRSTQPWTIRATASRRGDVARDRLEVAAGGADPREGLLRRVEIAIDADDRCALLGEPHGDGAAVAPAGPRAGGAGDDRDLAREPTRGHGGGPSSAATPSGSAT
jgi:hypothetical protein